MDEALCPFCGGAGCRLCDYTGSEPSGESDWFEAAKDEAERKIIDNQ